MKYTIVADSSCDMTPQLRERLGVITAPLTLTLGEHHYVDDDSLDLQKYMEQMRAFPGTPTSAAPSPESYCNGFLAAETAFGITLSGNLSGSYASAMVGKSLAEEKGGDVHVFDSKSASAGEILVALKTRALINLGKTKEEIILAVEMFIKRMKTFFVLEDLGNLIKNGRMSRIKGRIISALNIRPLLGSDGDGNIAFYSIARGEKQSIEKLARTVEESKIDSADQTMVITHCNNAPFAEKLKKIIKERYSFQEILVVPTRGLSSMYANEKGVVIAF